MSLVLQAGPYATASSSREDEPAAFPTASGSELPVNALNITSSADWRFIYSLVSDIATSGTYVTAGLSDAEVNQSFSVDPGTFEYEGIYFRYQAKNSWDMTGTYDAEDTGQGAFIRFSIDLEPVPGDDQVFTDAGASINGSFSVTMPAATKPQLVYLTFFSEGAAARGNITFDLAS